MIQNKNNKKTQLIIISKLKKLVAIESEIHAIIPIEGYFEGNEINFCKAKMTKGQQLIIGEDYLFSLEHKGISDRILIANLIKAKGL